MHGTSADPVGERAAGNGCAALVALAALAAREAASEPGVRRFLGRLGSAGAGIRPGAVGLLDLARAGRNTLPGRGFRDELCDGTDGQVRHFCGIVVACGRFGKRLTRLISIHLRRDPADSPDGRLTDLAIEFVRLLQDRSLDVADAPDWLGRKLCAPEPEADVCPLPPCSAPPA